MLVNGFFFVALGYHPPHSIYADDTFIGQLSDCIESIITRQSDCLLVVAGDFNTLNADFLGNNFGLSQLVGTPTHG
jgi:hypothetical protein